jgi:charged multivesicular body protein 7
LLPELNSASSTTTSQIYTPATLAPLLPVPLSDTDLTILLTYLSRDNPHIGLLPGTSSHPTIIKLASSSKTTEPITITSQDIDIASLKSLHESLLSTIPPLESLISEHTQSAKKYLQSKNETLAKASLRRKALASSTLDQRLKSVERLEEMLNKIDEAETNVALLSAMEQASRALKGINQKVGGVEAVDKIMDGWQDAVDDANEVDEALRTGARLDSAVDEEEVDEELEKMMEDEKRKEKEKEELEVKRRMEELERYERENAEKAKAKAEAEAETAKANASAIVESKEVSVSGEQRQQEEEDVKVEEARKELADMAI